jgi:thymidylate synthase ThyX
VKEVDLVDHTPEADLKLLAALLHTSTNQSFRDCLKKVYTMSGEKKREIIKTALKNMEFFDSTLREFEFVDLTFELVVSSACFGQLKRHRMATMTCQPYDPSLGVTIPKALDRSACSPIIKKTEAAYQTIFAKVPLAAPYILTGAHRKRVLFKCNARELYHISRLREDEHAQWDIQKIAREMSELAKGVMPLTMLTIGGKDAYPGIYEKLFGKKPKTLPLY